MTDTDTQQTGDQQLAAFDPEREITNAEMKFTESGVGLIEFQLASGETEEMSIPRERAGGLWKMIKDQCEMFDLEGGDV